MRLRTSAALSAGALACVAVAARPAPAQDTVAVAGEQYRAGAFVRMLNGDGYRAEWTTPVHVSVLDPERFAGGLRITQAGGGNATKSLRMLGADGREYVFRSVDKTAGRGLPEDLQGSFVEWFVQDLTSAKHPGSAHLLPPLLDAVDVLHATPTLYLMPDHPFLGEHREDFAGRLGQVEERPEDAEDKPGPVFADADRIVGSDRLFERLEEDPDERVDGREFLAARLVDLVAGDWDRHLDQWRWAGFEDDGDIRWRPIPRDRDNAFSNYRGLVPAVGRSFAPNLARFGPRWRDLQGYFHLPTPLDRRLLTQLDRAAWDSVTASVQTRLTDAVIAGAVRQMPVEWQPLGADELAAALRWRRDHLDEASAALYLRLASDVDVRASDEDDRADITRHPDGSVDVAVFEEDGRTPYFRRRFVPEETREIRIYLHGGDDRAVIRGNAARSIQVRLIGGGGDDVLADSSTGGRRGMSVLHDDRGDNQLFPGREGRVDTRDWEEPDSVRGLFGNQPAAQDWGAEFSPVAPWGAWVANVGPVIGAGPLWTRYGFRRQPYARQVGVRVLYAPLEEGIGIEGHADFVRTGRPSGLRLAGGARTFDVVRFHGLGNDSPGENSEAYEVTSNEVRAEATWYGRLGARGSWRMGPMARWLDPRAPAFTEVPTPPGGDGFVQFGALGELRLDARDTLPVTRSGWWIGAGARGFGSDVGGPFGSARGEARTYLSLGAGPILALRVGGEVVGGDFPFAEAAFLGGSGSLRGYPYQRFAGDAAAFGSAELRQPLGQVRLLVRGRLGVFALADAGRVWMDGESAGDWHTDYGGGLWFETLGIPLTLTYARGDIDRVMVDIGMPF